GAFANLLGGLPRKDSVAGAITPIPWPRLSLESPMLNSLTIDWLLEVGAILSGLIAMVWAPGSMEANDCGAACRPHAPVVSLSGTFKSALVRLRLTVPVFSVAYITEGLSVLWPNPSAWPNSCVTTVSKSYWDEAI